MDHLILEISFTGLQYNQNQSSETREVVLTNLNAETKYLHQVFNCFIGAENFDRAIKTPQCKPNSG